MRELSKFDVATIEDTGEHSLNGVRNLCDADEDIRLTKSQVEALLEYNRAVTVGRMGTKVVVEMVPDDDATAPIEIKEPRLEGDA
jgi:hypothetical protein